jgi:hypothetical protein
MVKPRVSDCTCEDAAFAPGVRPRRAGCRIFTTEESTERSLAIVASHQMSILSLAKPVVKSVVQCNKQKLRYNPRIV